MQPLSYTHDYEDFDLARQPDCLQFIMRVATYTQSSSPTGGSVFALGVLLLTILLGTGIVPTVAAFVSGVLPLLITPLWLGLYLCAFLGLMFQHGINWISWLVRYRILLVLLLIGTVISVAWSIDAQVSAERVVHLIGSSLIAIFIGFTIPLLITLRVFAIVLALAIFVSVAVSIGLPALGLQEYEGTQVWRGVFNSKNDLGFWAGVGVLLYITLTESSHSIGTKSLCYLMAIICLGVLALSQSATSVVAMLVAGALSLYIYIASRFQLGFIRMAVIAILFVALTTLAITNIETTELVGRSGDLTGRGEVWRQVLQLIYEHPLTGVGYGSLWFPTEATLWIQQTYFDFTWKVYHAHNGLLHIASEIGIPLAMIALLMVAQQLIEVFYCQYERQQAGVLFVLGFAVAFLLSNYSEARFLVTRELFWIFFIALPISMLRQVNLAGADPAQHDSPDAAAQVPGKSVPGKPWLGPLPRELPKFRARPIAPIVSSDENERTVYSDEEISEFDLSLATVSLIEADIDLGEMLDESHPANALTDAVSPIVNASSNVPEDDGKHDTFGVDRYDMDLDHDLGEHLENMSLEESK